MVQERQMSLLRFFGAQYFSRYALSQQANGANGNEIYGDDVYEETRHGRNQNTSRERRERLNLYPSRHYRSLKNHEYN